MTRHVISVHEETLLADVATLFIKHRIRRMPVVDKGRLVGIISRSNLLRYVVQSGDIIEDYLKDVKSYAESHAEEFNTLAN
jgi:CBS-domain-containing membrane protein